MKMASFMEPLQMAVLMTLAPSLNLILQEAAP
jgi:hypothetical protein